MRFIKIQLFLLALFLLMARPASATSPVLGYDQWKNLSSHALLEKGEGFWAASKMDSALVCCVILSSRYSDDLSKSEKDICCEAKMEAGWLYHWYFNDYQSAYRCYLTAEKIAQENHFTHRLADIYTHMATLMTDRLDIESNYAYQQDVLELFKKSFYNAIKMKREGAVGFAFGNLAYYATIHHHVADIRPELEAFYKLDLPDGFRYKMFFRTMCEGVVAYDGDKVHEALERFSRLDDLVPEKGINPSTMVRIQSMICLFKYVALMSLNQPVEALKQLDFLEQNEAQSQLTDGIPLALHMKHKHYESQGNAVMAREYELKYFRAKDDFVFGVKLFDLDKQKFLIELEEMCDEVKALEQQKRIRDLVAWGIGLFAIIILSVLVYVWRNYQNTKERNLVLFQKNEELLDLEAQEKVKPSVAKKYKSSPMDDPAKDELLQRLFDIMENCPDIYGEGFTLDQLAHLANSNPNYVSQVINEKRGVNFNVFVNEYRIKEACRRLTDKQQFGGLTIEAIGHSLGFKSRANFAATFKKFTGLSPATYQRMAREDNALSGSDS